MTSKLEGALDETERLMKENIQDDKNWSGIKDLRNATGIEPKELNNIMPPDVLKQSSLRIQFVLRSILIYLLYHQQMS